MTARRVAVVSTRGLVHHPANAMLYEFEDLICEWENAELIEITRYHGHPTFDRRRLIYQGLRTAHISPALALRALSPRRRAPEQRFDIGIIVALGPFDLFVLDELQTLRDACDKLVVFVAEAWPPSIEGRALPHEPWALADHVFVGLAPAAELMASVIPAPVSFLALGVDAPLFAECSSEARPIDVYNPGRRAPRQHDRLLAEAEASERWYEFDTVSGASVRDPRQHRQQYASTIGRANIVITNHAKFDMDPSLVGTEPVAPGRVLEGVAAGCLLAGSGIPGTALADLGLPTDLVEPFGFEPSPSDARRLLERASDTAAQASAHKLAGSTLDWGHRWKAVLDTIGEPPTPGLSTRLDRLGAA